MDVPYLEKEQFHSGISEIVTVISRDGKVIAAVHQELICAQSAHVARLLSLQAELALQQADDQASALTLVLPFDEVPKDEEAVAKSLVYWLYRERIFIPNAVRQRSLEVAGSYGFLCKLWLVAEKWQLQSLKNDVVDGVWGLYQANKYISNSIVTYVYKYSPESLSAIRRLFITIMKVGLKASKINAMEDILPKDFFADLNDQQFDNLDREYMKTMDREFCHRFHEHDSEEKCVVVKVCE